ncbi:MAG: hypothetical protein COB90_09750 [Hyphomicrobiales bacterium]|nr:MAG: hypothetical protein COB90_09750 [Hyphomicrobiales bacterium]
MAGSIIAGTIVDADGKPVDLIGQEGAKSRLTYDGVTNAIEDSLNVSSVTDNGTGQYSVVFINVFDDVRYSCIGSATTNEASSGLRIYTIGLSYTANFAPLQLVGSHRICIVYTNHTRYDCEFIHETCYGRLA